MVVATTAGMVMAPERPTISSPSSAPQRAGLAFHGANAGRQITTTLVPTFTLL
ncbi:MAG: hypothetical protein QOC56_374 [Alphaproteobacteria bacterium]|nr:hypothetical protein [Alphaproteobacteria bacterium]